MSGVQPNWSVASRASLKSSAGESRPGPTSDTTQSSVYSTAQPEIGPAKSFVNTGEFVSELLKRGVVSNASSKAFKSGGVSLIESSAATANKPNPSNLNSDTAKVDVGACKPPGGVVAVRATKSSNASVAPTKVTSSRPTSSEASENNHHDNVSAKLKLFRSMSSDGPPAPQAGRKRPDLAPRAPPQSSAVKGVVSSFEITKASAENRKVEDAVRKIDSRRGTGSSRGKLVTPAGGIPPWGNRPASGLDGESKSVSTENLRLQPAPEAVGNSAIFSANSALAAGSSSKRTMSGKAQASVELGHNDVIVQNIAHVRKPSELKINATNPLPKPESKTASDEQSLYDVALPVRTQPIGQNRGTDSANQVGSDSKQSVSALDQTRARGIRQTPAQKFDKQQSLPMPAAQKVVPDTTRENTSRTGSSHVANHPRTAISCPDSAGVDFEASDLYEEAAIIKPSLVRGRKLVEESQRAPLPPHQSNVLFDEEALYEDAAAVHYSRLPQDERQRSSNQSEPLTQKVVNKKSSGVLEAPKLPPSLDTAEEESLYAEVLPVINTKRKNQQQTASVNSCTGIHSGHSNVKQVASTRATHNEAAMITIGGVGENRLNDAPVGRKNVDLDEGDSGEDSSGEEDAVYEMLMLKKAARASSMLSVTQADSKFARDRLEKDARRLSHFSCAGATERTPEQQALTPSAIAENDESDQTQESDEMDGLLDASTVDDQMRRWVVDNCLTSEREYVDTLEVLLQYKQCVQSLVGTSRSVLIPPEIQTVFHLLPELAAVHRQCVSGLAQRVDAWGAGQEVAPVFRQLVSEEFGVAREYLRNYQKAIATSHQRCTTSFASFITAYKDKGISPETSLEDLLHRPIVRLQSNTLVLHDLIKCTPSSHADYCPLVSVRKTAQDFLNECTGNAKSADQRYLVKRSIIVEQKQKSGRKIRHVFLFNDLLVCARQKMRIRFTYEVCWFFSLNELTLEHNFSVQEEKRSAVLHQQENESVQQELVRLQAEHRAELRRIHSEGGLGRSTSEGCQVRMRSEGLQPGIKQSKTLEKIRKKILLLEARLMIQAPHLKLLLRSTRTAHCCTLLMASDYERNTWRDTIAGLAPKCPAAGKLSTTEVQNLINTQKAPELIGSISDNDLSVDEDRLDGNLNVTIHKLQGLSTFGKGTFCSIEIDSFGHFAMRAKTNICKTKTPKAVWEEDFDIDLQGAQTLHIQCYQIGDKTDALLGQCALELHKAWLDEDFKQQPIAVGNEMSLTISLKFTAADNIGLKRASMRAEGEGAIFGVPLELITKREGRRVPLLVTSCIEEIESRRMKELGLYRVSGLSSEVERLKKAFNKNSLAASGLVKQADSHILTSLIKLFFRELPEVLFTDALYTNFANGIGLADPDARERYMIAQLKALPPANYATTVYLINHLVRVSSHIDTNKMSLANLATVFGPTLLRPAVRDQKLTAVGLFYQSISDVTIQSSILLCLFSLTAKSLPASLAE